LKFQERYVQLQELLYEAVEEKEEEEEEQSQFQY
jgi:hypothetical protein